MKLPLTEVQLESGVVLRGIGQVVALVGPNGAGKSRALKHIGMKAKRQSIDPIWFNTKSTNFTKTDSNRSTIDNAHQQMIQNRDDPGTSTYLVYQSISDRYLDAMNPSTRVSDRIREDALRQFERVKRLVELLLGTDLEPIRTGQVHVFNRPIDSAELSPGQCRLLHFIARFFDPTVAERDVVLFLDEPEQNLHPSAVIEMYRILREVLPKAQFFIATHCLPFIASLPPESIYLMRNGKVMKATDTPDDVVDSLLGGPDNAEALRTFLDRPADLALHRFAVESLCPPGTAAHRDGDPQTNQVRALVEKLRGARGDQPLKLLDWGAGQGRLGVTLLSECGLNGSLDYSAFEKNGDNLAKCRDALERHGLPVVGKLFAQVSDLKNACNGRPFDVIALVNVLHEINPQEWVATLQQMDKCLAPDGALIILEDQQMPVGEHAHECGFVVLHEAAMRRLFDDQSNRHIVMSTPSEPAKYQNRLTAFAVPKACLSQVTGQTKNSALECVRDHARDRIVELRGRTGAQGAKAGRELARYLLLFANADLAGG